jgi:hypothetical protein
MSLLRFLSLLVLTVWVGGLAVLGGIAAPAIFDVLEAADSTGRETAGLVFGAVFGQFQRIVWALALLLLGLMGARAALGPRPKRLAWRMWTISAMFALSLATGLYVAPRIDAIRLEVGGPVASLPETDPRRTEFGRLHGASSAFMLITLLAGTWLIWIESKESMGDG